MRRSGQSLIEVIFAIAIFAVAVIGSTVLARTATRANTEAGRRTQATALATREFEAVRQYRDEAVKRGLPWDAIWPNLIIGTCANFVMQPGVLDTPWTWVPTGTPQKFDAAVDPSQNFSRIVRVCDSHDVLEIPGGPFGNTYTLIPGNKVKTFEIKVVWEEADGVTREVIYRSALASDEEVDL